MECEKNLKKLCIHDSNEKDASNKYELIEIDKYNMPSWIPLELVKDACRICLIKLLRAVNFQSLCEKSDTFLRTQNDSVAGDSVEPYQFSDSSDEEENKFFKSYEVSNILYCII